MSTNLQKVVAKSKVSTLDGDLKDIAEEMLREKFGFREDVVEQSTASFRGPDEFLGIRLDDVFVEPSDADRDRQFRGRVRFDFDPQTRGSVATAFISRRGTPLDGIVEAARCLDGENLSRENRRIYIHEDRMRHIMRDVNVRIETSPLYSLPRLWGMDLIVVPFHVQERIEVTSY